MWHAGIRAHSGAEGTSGDHGCHDAKTRRIIAVLKIRERKNIPIIVLSAKSEDTDKVLGLSMGADDYVAKPYNPQELAARVKSHLRRYIKSWGYP